MSKIWKPLSKSLRVLNRLNNGKKDRDDAINQETIRSLASKHEQVQQRIFTRWINLHLATTGLAIHSVDKDLRDGRVLHNLLKQLTKESIPDIDKKNTRFHQLSNVSVCLTFLETKLGELPNIGSSDIVDGNLKLTLGLIWLIILRFQIQQALTSDLQNSRGGLQGITNSSLSFSSSSLNSLSKLDRDGSDRTLFSRSATKEDPKSFLLGWVQTQLRAYEGLIPSIRDFHCSWQSGVAFAALIHRYDPQLLSNLGEIVEKTTRDPESWKGVLEEVFRIALEEMGVPSLLEPDDILSVSIPDEKIIMMYVTEFYKVMSSKQQHIEAQELNSTRSLVDQFMLLAESISTQLDQFFIEFDYDLFNVSKTLPKHSDKLSQEFLLRNQTLEDYEPTIMALDRSITSLSVSLSKIDTGLMNSVNQTRDGILERWKALEEKLGSYEKVLDLINQWGGVTSQIDSLEQTISEQGRLCSEYMELKTTWTEKEKTDRVAKLETAIHACQSQFQTINKTNFTDAPDLVHDKLRRCRELLDIVSTNLDQIQINLEVTKYTNELSDSLLTLFHKRSELRKLNKLTPWSVNRNPSAEISAMRAEQDQWIQTQGLELLETVKSKCAAIRLAFESSKRDRSSQLQPVLLKESEIMVSWDEINRLLSIQTLFADQADAVEVFNGRFKAVVDRTDHIQECFETQKFDDHFSTTIVQLLDDLSLLNTELQELPYSDSPELESTNSYIFTHFDHNIQALTHHLLDLKAEFQTVVAEQLINKESTKLSHDGHEFIQGLKDYLTWFDTTLFKFNHVSFEDAETLFSATEKETDVIAQTLQAQKTTIEDWQSHYENHFPHIKTKTLRDELRTLSKDIVFQRKQVEANLTLMQKIVPTGINQAEILSRLIQLQEELDDLASTVAQFNEETVTLLLIADWTRQLRSLDASLEMTSSKFDSSRYMSKLQSFYGELISSVTQKSLATKSEIDRFDLQLRSIPFQKFNEETSQFFSLSKDLFELVKKSLELGQISTVDDAEVLEAKISSLSQFVSPLRDNTVSLKEKHIFLNNIFVGLQSLPPNPLMEVAIKNHDLMTSTWDQVFQSVSAVTIIYGQIKILTRTVAKLWQVDIVIQQTREDIKDLLDITDSEILDTKIPIFESLLTKLDQLLEIEGTFTPPSLPSGVSREVTCIRDYNHRQVLDLVEHISSNMNATQTLFRINQEKAMENCTRAQIINLVEWKNWCLHQVKVLELDRRHLQVALWKKSSANVGELLTKALSFRDSLTIQTAENLQLYEDSLSKAGSSKDELDTHGAFHQLHETLSVQMDAIPIAKKLQDHWTLILKDQRWIAHHRKVLEARPVSEASIQAVDKAMADPTSELSLSHQAFLASAPDFDDLCRNLEQDPKVFQFIDPPQFEKIKKESDLLHDDWQSLGRSVIETRELIQAGEMCHAIHENIESLYSQIQALSTDDIRRSKETAFQLDMIQKKLDDQILNQVREWQTVFFGVPRDNSGWSSKIKMTSELVDLVSRAIKEKQDLLLVHQASLRLLELEEEITHWIADLKSTTDSITKSIEKSSTFLVDLEKASKQLIEVFGSATNFIDQYLTDFYKGAKQQENSQLVAKAEDLSFRWEEVSRDASLLETRLNKKIDFKRKAAEAHTERKVQRAKSRTVQKYTPPDKNKVGSRYMEFTKKSKDKDLSKRGSQDPSPNRYLPDSNDQLDVEVAKIVNRFPQRVHVERDAETGKYWIGKRDPKLFFCRVLPSTMVMVRIGGGWAELSKHLGEHSNDSDMMSDSNSPSSTSGSRSHTPFRSHGTFDSMGERTSGLAPPSTRPRSNTNGSTSSDRNGSPLYDLSDSPRSKTPTGPFTASAPYAKHTFSSISKSRHSTTTSSTSHATSRAISPLPHSRVPSPLGDRYDSMKGLLARPLRNSQSLASFRPTP